MKKKHIWVISIFVLLYQVFCPIVAHVQAYDWANKQPEVCWWPSEMMSQYFSFQKEAQTILWWSNLSKRYSTNMWNNWLFTSWILELPSALDFVVSDVLWKTKSTFSTATTSMVLMMLISASVLQSNTEWFAILFKDRPIVRDYKKMLDIETELFDIAYFQSKEINLTLPVQWNEFYEKFNNLIKKYQKSGLLEDTGSLFEGGESMADIIMELVEMNTAMKHFILFLGRPWTKALQNYNWCFWKIVKENCTSVNAIGKFSQKAMNTLKEDYSGLWTFWACNLYASNFKNTIAKSFNNNTASVKASFQDVKDAMKRLKWALVGDYDDSGDWDMHISKNGINCNMSEYEMAQLKAYWWSDWECGKGIDMSVAMPKISEYARNKSAQNEQRKKDTNLMRGAATTIWTWSSFTSEIAGENKIITTFKNAIGDEKKKQIWYNIYGSGDAYNTEFIYDMENDIDTIYQEIMWEYYQSQQNAMASDPAYTLKWKIKWLIDQVSATMKSATILQNDLQTIANYQCAS